MKQKKSVVIDKLLHKILKSRATEKDITLAEELDSVLREALKDDLIKKVNIT